LATEVTGVLLEVLVAPAVSTKVSGIFVEALVTPEALPEPPMPNCDPSQYLIIPDTRIEGRANVVSATSEQGPFPGPSVGDSGNDGQIYPTQSGSPSDTAEDVVYQIIREGGLGSAEFVYRKESAATDQFFGKDDPRRWFKFSTPFTSSVPGADSNTCVYSDVFRRILVFGDSTTGDGTIYCRYRDIGTDYTSWTEVTFTPEIEQESFDHSLSAVELPDGVLLLFIYTDNAGGALNDYDIYRSEDGGTTWQIHARKIINRFVVGGFGGAAWPGGYAAAKFRVARSGDYIRLVQVVNDGGNPRLNTLVSTDRGITWTHAGGGPATDQNVDTHGGSDDQYPFDLVATNEAATGGFLLFSKETATTFTTRVASGVRQWEEITAGGFTAGSSSTEFRGLCVVNTGSHLIQLLFFSGATVNDNYSMRRFDLSKTVSPAVSLNWEAVDDCVVTTGFRHIPIRSELINTGEGLACYFAVADQQGSYVEESLAVMGFLDVWTKASFGEAGPGSPLVGNGGTGTLEDFWWTAWGGRPAPVGDSQVSNDTLWAQQTSGTPSISSTQERLYLTATTIGHFVRYRLDMTALLTGTGTAYQTDGSTVRWIAKPDNGDGDASGTGFHVRMSSSQALAGSANTVDVIVRFSATEVTVRDANASSDLETLTLDLDSAEHEFFLFVIDLGSSVVGYLTVVNLHTGQMDRTPQFTLSESFVLINNVVDFGLNAMPVSATWGVEFRELGIAVGKNTQQNDPTNPGDLFGAVCKSAPQSVEEGLDVAWVGAAASVGDEFNGKIGHAYSADNVLVPSPRVPWRSTGVVTTDQSIVFDADPVNGVGRFFHDAASFFGITDGSIVVEYDDNPDFTSPFVAITLTPSVFSGIAISGVRGNTVFVNAAIPSHGEAVGMILEWTSGTASGLRMLVTQHWASGGGTTSYLTMGDEAVDLATQGVSVSDTFTLYAQNTAGKYAGGTIDGLRYMRISVTGNDTHTDDHRIGTMIVGQAFDFTVPLDWRHSDNEQPNVTQYRTKGAIGWAFEEGPTQRTITARFVGDANRFREELANLLRSLVGFEVFPVALVLDDDREDMTVFLGRIRTGSQLDNAAWYFDANGIRRTAGDETFSIVEEP